MKHYLITPWNVDNLDMEWLKRRRWLFEEMCLPSVQSQTNTDFEWLLIADTRTPASFKKIINAYPATVVWYNFAKADWTIPPQTRMATIRAPKMKRAIRLECVVAAPLRNHIGVVDTDYVITSRLDSDDAISIDHIAKIQRYVANYVQKEERFWLNLTRGLKFCRGSVYPINGANNPFISFVEPAGELLTTYQTSHGQASSTGFPIVKIREGDPTWIQTIHGGNLMNKLMRKRGKKPLSAVSGIFKVEPKHYDLTY